MKVANIKWIYMDHMRSWTADWRNKRLATIRLHCCDDGHKYTVTFGNGMAGADNVQTLDAAKNFAEYQIKRVEW